MFYYAIKHKHIAGFDIIDLSVPIVPERKVPGELGYSDPIVRMDKMIVADWTTTDIKPYFVSKIVMGAHTGTHIDAGMHVTGNRDDSIDHIDQNLIGECVIVDVTDDLEENTLIGMLKRANEKSIIVIRGQANCSALTDNLRENIVLKHPKAVVFGECVNVVGVDDTMFFCGRKIPMIMDGVNLDKLCNGDIIFALPVLIEGIEASPVRLFALRFKEIDTFGEDYLPSIEGD